MKRSEKIKMKNEKNICVDNPSIHPSFDEMLDEIKMQIDFDCFPFVMMPQAYECACIMTEIARMRPTDKIRVDGAIRSISDVQHVYSKLTHEHIEFAIDGFNQTPYVVRNPKNYMRSTLYNAYFTMDSSTENLFRAAGGAP